MPQRFRRLFLRLRRSGLLPKALPVAAALALALLAVHGLNRELRPVLETAAASQASNLLTRAISAAVDDCLSSGAAGYDDFVTLERDQSGRVTALRGDTVESSRFRRQVVNDVISRIEALDARELSVPLGNLTGQLLLSGLGPSVRVQVYSVGDVTAEYRHTFAEAGVNQTLHRVELDVTATVDLFLPGEILPVTVQNAVCVAETVIVGETPDAYLNLEQRSG